METITRRELQGRINRDGLEVVEVLGSSEYREAHLPGAVNVPLSAEFDEAIKQMIPDETTPVVVYCKDEDCDASTRAAQRMQELGYADVKEFVGGKTAWKAAGLPVESGSG